MSANDCFRPVSRYFDRISRPEQLIPALQRAMSVLTDPAECGPVTLAMCQDVQTEAFDWPESLFAERVWTPRRVRPDVDELAAAVATIKAAKRPMIIAGGGVLYSGASAELTAFAETHGVPVAVSQAGKSSIDETHPLALGAIGVTGTSAANALAADADLLIAVGTRLQDFTTGSWALFKSDDLKILALNVAALRHRQARGAAARLRRQGRPDRALGGACAAGGPTAPWRSAREGEGRLVRRGGGGARLDQRRAALRRRR